MPNAPIAALAAAAFALAAAALAAAISPASASAGLHVRTKRRLVGGWARSVPVSRRRSRKHPQRRGERRCVGRRPYKHLDMARRD